MGLEKINDPIVKAYYAGRCNSDNESISLQDKTITENGSYTADAGYDGFGTVTVEVDDGSKLIAELEAEVTELETWKSENEFYANTMRERLATTDLNNMFYDCTSLTTVPLFDTSECTTMNGMFYNCTSLTTVPLFDTSECTTMNNMFYDCTSLTTVPLFDTSKVTSMTQMFKTCTSLTTVPLFDTSKVTNMNSMFYNCTSLTTVPLFDTSECTTMNGMLDSCTNLTTVPLFDTSKVTNMGYMFRGCTSLTTVPLFDTSQVTNMSAMFFSCTSLTTVPLFDMRNATSIGNMLNNCNELTDCYLRNIKTALQVGSGTFWGHLLTVDSLVHLIYELRDTGSVKKLTVGSANLEKLANVYVRTIDITDEMRAEDDLVDEKLPFEVCESTDEGATLITQYVIAKNWAIA